MKDKELSKRVDKLARFIERHIGRDAYVMDCFFDGYLYKRIKSLENQNLKVLYCKRCKHDTLQEKRLGGTLHLRVDAYCLTCGTLWHCEEKTVCKEVK